MERIAKTLCDDPKALKKTVNRLESESNGDFKMLPVSVKNGAISFGGPCSEAMRRIERANNGHKLSDDYKAQTALTVFHCMTRSLQKMLTYHWEQRPAGTLIAVGGVMLTVIYAKLCLISVNPAKLRSSLHRLNTVPIMPPV